MDFKKSDSEEPNHFSLFVPDDVLLHLLRYLSFENTCRVCRTNQRWMRAANRSNRTKPDDTNRKLRSLRIQFRKQTKYWQPWMKTTEFQPFCRRLSLYNATTSDKGSIALIGRYLDSIPFLQCDSNSFNKHFPKIENLEKESAFSKLRFLDLVSIHQTQKRVSKKIRRALLNDSLNSVDFRPFTSLRSIFIPYQSGLWDTLIEQCPQLSMVTIVFPQSRSELIGSNDSLLNEFNAVTPNLQMLSLTDIRFITPFCDGNDIFEMESKELSKLFECTPNLLHFALNTVVEFDFSEGNVFRFPPNLQSLHIGRNGEFLAMPYDFPIDGCIDISETCGNIRYVCFPLSMEPVDSELIVQNEIFIYSILNHCSNLECVLLQSVESMDDILQRCIQHRNVESNATDAVTEYRTQITDVLESFHDLTEDSQTDKELQIKIESISNADTPSIIEMVQSMFGCTTQIEFADELCQYSEDVKLKLLTEFNRSKDERYTNFLTNLTNNQISYDFFEIL